MTKRILAIILSFCAVTAYALDVECVGVATQVVKGNDTTFIFRDEIHLRSKVGPVDWYDANGNLYASNMTEIYPDEGCYEVNGSRFCAQVYMGIDDLDFTIETSCENTLLRVTGDIHTRAHTYSIEYNALAWDTEKWADSLALMSGNLMSTIVLPPLYGPTPIKLCYDADVRAALGLDSACLTVDLEDKDVKAVKMELTSLVTARGKDGEKSNERNRPTSQDLITGSEYSGPLEVAFYSNPTPAGQFFRWSIYKAAELIVTRNDQDIRYTFSDPGSYRVVCSVNNGLCQTDSSEVTVAIAESYLAVPNVFTPNGDGKNDEFRVAYRSLREFHCWVYNRWGKLVLEWDDPAKGWDGTIGGKPAAEGAYFYVIRALGTDANEGASYVSKAAYKKGKLNADGALIGVYQLSGDINLLRGKK